MVLVYFLEGIGMLATERLEGLCPPLRRCYRVRRGLHTWILERWPLSYCWAL